MITKVNSSNSADYLALFQKASARVAGNISNLDQYFSLLNSLATIPVDDDKVNYVRLPLDEPPFEIDANSRNIIVPAEFKKNGVSVKGDHYAEILYFIIDRYFDDVDFARNDFNIIIQWEDSKGNQGVSKAIFKDIYAYANEGKLLFGWGLTDIITQNAGPLKFSVRIYKFGAASAGAAAGLIYSFSTLTQSVTILSGLDYTIEGTDQFGEIPVAVNDQAQLLNRISSYQQQYIDTGTTPHGAEFTKYLGVVTIGEDANHNSTIAMGTPTTDSTHSKEADLVNNALTFAVQAKPVVDGQIFYNWHWFDKNGSNQSSNLNIENVYVKTADTNPDTGKLYYTKAVVNEVPQYTVVSGNDVVAADFPANYYELYSVCHVAYDGETEVTGSYYVEVNNVYTSDNNNVNNAIVTSKTITIPTPGAVVLTTTGTHITPDEEPLVHRIVDGDTTTLQVYAYSRKNDMTVTDEDEKISVKFYDTTDNSLVDNDERSYAAGTTDNALKYELTMPVDPAARKLFNKTYKAVVTATRNGSASMEVEKLFQVTAPLETPTVTLSNDVALTGPSVEISATITNAAEIAHDSFTVKWYKVVAPVGGFDGDTELTSGFTFADNVTTLTVTEPGTYYPVITNNLNGSSVRWEPTDVVNDVISVLA